MTRSPLLVIAYAVTALWAFAVGTLTLAQATHWAQLPAAELAAIVAGVLAPPTLLWLGVGIRLQSRNLQQRLSAFERRQEELSLQIRLLLDSVRHTETEGKSGNSGRHPIIQVMEGEDVGPEFIHRNTEVADDWVEVEFRNVGGPASNLMAITEGDTETRVTSDSVGSWKSVRVSLQPVISTDNPFRFCLVFKNARGDEKQQFFRYAVDNVVSISKPDS